MLNLRMILTFDTAQQWVRLRCFFGSALSCKAVQKALHQLMIPQRSNCQLPIKCIFWPAFLWLCFFVWWDPKINKTFSRVGSWLIGGFKHWKMDQKLFNEQQKSSLDESNLRRSFLRSSFYWFKCFQIKSFAKEGRSWMPRGSRRKIKAVNQRKNFLQVLWLSSQW